ncbi:hypothetical protein THAOC_07582, partial [Thalassiosira oceanica]
GPPPPVSAHAAARGHSSSFGTTGPARLRLPMAGRAFANARRGRRLRAESMTPAAGAARLGRRRLRSRKARGRGGGETSEKSAGSKKIRFAEAVEATATSDTPAPDQSEARRGERPTDTTSKAFGCSILNVAMSCVPVAGDGDEVCANCGKQGSDTVKLRKCTACRLVKYCGVDCQRAHRKQHKKACKQRVAELKDEQLYSQGHQRPEGDFCPICTLPIPLLMDDYSSFNACCMKRICHGCHMAAKKRGLADCPFCRTPYPKNDAVGLALVKARVLKKDPEAINNLGQQYYHGRLGLHKDMRKAVELFTEAAELGSVEALFNLGNVYYFGEGVQEDKLKGAEFYTRAAMQGHVGSRHNLGQAEARKGNFNRAVKHWMISAKMGEKTSIENMKRVFTTGLATKKQYAEAMNGYQDAIEEMKSDDRDEAMRFG